MRMTVRSSFWLGIAWQQAAPPLKAIAWTGVLLFAGTVLVLAGHVGVPVSIGDVLQLLRG